MKSDMGMDAPDTPASERRYESFKELAADVEGLIDTLWASATREFHILYMHYIVQHRSEDYILLYIIFTIFLAFHFLYLILTCTIY